MDVIRNLLVQHGYATNAMTTTDYDRPRGCMSESQRLRKALRVEDAAKAAGTWRPGWMHVKDRERRLAYEQELVQQDWLLRQSEEGGSPQTY